MKNKPTTFEELAARCHELRNAAQSAEARLLVFLCQIEDDEDLVAMIEDAGQSFMKFVESDVLVKPSHYTRFRAGFELLDWDEDRAVNMGTDAVIQLRKVNDASKIPEYEYTVNAWSEMHNGAKPSRETAAQLVTKVDPRAEASQSVTRLTRIQELEKENRELRARLREAQAEIKALRKENKDLKQELKRERSGRKKSKNGKKKGTSRKSPDKRPEL